MLLVTEYKPAQKSLIIAGGVAGTYIAAKVLLRLYNARRERLRRESYPKNVVILHQFPKSDAKPSISGPCLKLETWLRFAEIKYENELSYFGRSSQGQAPFITLNTEEYHDSQFIIEHLSKVYGNDLHDSLSEGEKGIARAFLKLVEESFKWTMYYHRFLVGKASDIGMPWLLVSLMKGKLRTALNVQGYGRHSKDEIYHIGKQDLTAVSQFLGEKKFLFGDRPGAEDAALFAYVANVAFYDKGPLGAHLRSECDNLIKFFERVRSTYWPEWVTPGWESAA